MVQYCTRQNQIGASIPTAKAHSERDPEPGGLSSVVLLIVYQCGVVGWDGLVHAARLARFMPLIAIGGWWGTLPAGKV
jgi:hypothetical protein